MTNVKTGSLVAVKQMPNSWIRSNHNDFVKASLVVDCPCGPSHFPPADCMLEIDTVVSRFLSLSVSRRRGTAVLCQE